MGLLMGWVLLLLWAVVIWIWILVSPPSSVEASLLSNEQKHCGALSGPTQCKHALTGRGLYLFCVMFSCLLKLEEIQGFLRVPLSYLSEDFHVYVRYEAKFTVSKAQFPIYHNGGTSCFNIVHVWSAVLKLLNLRMSFSKCLCEMIENIASMQLFNPDRYEFFTFFTQLIFQNG